MDSQQVLQLIARLLPKNSRWALTSGKWMSKVLKGVATSFVRAGDSAFNTLYLETVVNDDTVESWEDVYGLPYANISTADRISRAQGAMFDSGNLGLDEIEESLHDLGLDLYVYPWWKFSSPPYTAGIENLFRPIGTAHVHRTGRPLVQANRTEFVGESYCGECYCGDFDSINIEPATERLASYAKRSPFDKTEVYYPQLLVIGGSPLGTFVDISASRRQEVIDLIRRRLPADAAFGLLINWV